MFLLCNIIETLILCRNLNERLSNGQARTYVEISFFFSSIIFFVVYLKGNIIVFGNIVVYCLELPSSRDIFFTSWLTLPLGRSDSFATNYLRKTTMIFGSKTKSNLDETNFVD